MTGRPINLFLIKCWNYFIIFGLKILIILQVKGTLSDMFVETLENRRTHWRSTSWRWKHQQEEICQRMMRRIWPQMKLPGIVTVFWRDESFRNRVLGEDTGNVSRPCSDICSKLFISNIEFPTLGCHVVKCTRTTSSALLASSWRFDDTNWHNL